MSEEKLAAQMYQVVGTLAVGELFDDKEVIRALDYLHGIASGDVTVDDNFLPFRPKVNE